jgi:hypothetical protein
MCKLLQLALFFILLSSYAPGQDSLVRLTIQDTLRGSVTPERAWWDVLKYDITVEPDPVTKQIKGENILTFKALADGKRNEHRKYHY